MSGFVAGIFEGNPIMPLPPVDLLEIGTLDSLIIQPTGCGEQTMIKMAPLVSAMNYLEETGQFQNNAPLRQKGIKDMQSGKHLLSWRFLTWLPSLVLEVNFCCALYLNCFHMTFTLFFQCR